MKTKAYKVVKRNTFRDIKSSPRLPKPVQMERGVMALAPAVIAVILELEYMRAF
jgi:hypothetical protein